MLSKLISRAANPSFSPDGRTVPPNNLSRKAPPQRSASVTSSGVHSRASPPHIGFLRRSLDLEQSSPCSLWSLRDVDSSLLVADG